MDSVTQAVLGAAVAHACWHRELGRWSLAWGVALGTLPDLDIVVAPWLDEAGFLRWHRGISHGLLPGLLVAWPLAWLVRRVHRRAEPPLSATRAWAGVALIWVTHVLIDWFTVYGTQLLAPFSAHGFQAGNLFIIDPLYTAPLLLGVALAALWRNARGRRVANEVGLVLSTLYVGWSFVGQAGAREVFAAELERQGVEVSRALTTATPLNTVLWRHLAEVEGGFLVGYWSWLDEDRRVTFEFVPRGDGAVGAEERASEAFATVEWFSHGYWTARRDEDGVLRLGDLRFGELRPEPGAPPETWGHVFAWRLEERDGEVVLVAARPRVAERTFEDVWRRLRGDRTAW